MTRAKTGGKGKDIQAPLYLPPTGVPNESEYRTLDNLKVRLAPEIDPRLAKTEVPHRRVRHERSSFRRALLVGLGALAFGAGGAWFLLLPGREAHKEPHVSSMSSAVEGQVVKRSASGTVLSQTGRSPSTSPTPALSAPQPVSAPLASAHAAPSAGAVVAPRNSARPSLPVGRGGSDSARTPKPVNVLASGGAPAEPSAKVWIKPPGRKVWMK